MKHGSIRVRNLICFFNQVFVHPERHEHRLPELFECKYIMKQKIPEDQDSVLFMLVRGRGCIESKKWEWFGSNIGRSAVGDGGIVVLNYGNQVWSTNLSAFPNLRAGPSSHHINNRLGHVLMSVMIKHACIWMRTGHFLFSRLSVVRVYLAKMSFCRIFYLLCI